jgi:hypothetical protein
VLRWQERCISPAMTGTAGNGSRRALISVTAPADRRSKIARRGRSGTATDRRRIERRRPRRANYSERARSSRNAASLRNASRCDGIFQCVAFFSDVLTAYSVFLYGPRQLRTRIMNTGAGI